ncbi:MAG: GNAT family N-acetyltransferase [Gemmatimonadota bacterium]
MSKIGDEDWFHSERLLLRLVTPEDCGERYLSWLCDERVNRYLETRWSEQTIESIGEFVAEMRASEENHLFAIVKRDAREHIGNIKLGPVNANHGYADISYFIGDPRMWGKGYATEAIRTATVIGFDVLGLHRLQAGVYKTNVGSTRALEKVGYRLEGRFRKQLRAEDGWQDHLWYGLLREEFKG